MSRSDLPISFEALAPASRTDGADAQEYAERPDVREEDLRPILINFYERVGSDELLRPYFADVDMDAHMSTIVDFWSTMVFQTRRYSGNAFKPHLDMPGLTHAHFARWLATLNLTVDDEFAGPHAERMKDLGQRVAYSMQIRLGISPAMDPRADVAE